MQIKNLRCENVREKKGDKEKILSRDKSVASCSLIFTPTMFPDPESPVTRVVPVSIARTTF